MWYIYTMEHYSALKRKEILFFSIFYWLCYYSFPNFPPLSPLCPVPANPPASPPPPLVHVHVHISSLVSLFPIPFFNSTCLFYAYQLCFLFPVPYLPTLPLPIDNPPCDLHFCDSVPVLVVCLVFVLLFSFFLRFIFQSCEFVVILLFIVFYFLQFLR